MNALEIRPGDRFTRGVVVEIAQVPAADGRPARRVARMLCDCGNEYTARPGSLKCGDSQSCGCLGRERKSQNVARLLAEGRWSRKHGLSKHPLYGGWSKMMSRCENPANPRYADWGGRGITVCPQWHDPARFIADIGGLLGPKPAGHTLDRIDNDGHYEPGNVRWATPKQQRANSRPYPKHRHTSRCDHAKQL